MWWGFREGRSCLRGFCWEVLMAVERVEMMGSELRGVWV